MIKKEKRKAVFNKFGGRCAYCGCEISERNFNEDHLKPLRRDQELETHEAIRLRGNDDFENLMPSCRSCNSWKKVYTIEQFRSEISKQIERLKRNSNQFCLALRYGLIQETGEPVKFYFERYLHGFILKETNQWD